MNFIKTIDQISNLNLRKWVANPKICILFILMIAVIYQPMAEVVLALENNNMKISPYLFPFLINSSYFKLVFIVGGIILFCDAPFKTPEQLFVISRANKTVWVLGQVLYIIKGLTIYYSFLFVCSFVMLLPNADFTQHWESGVETFGNAGLTTMLNINPMITQLYTPFWAIVHTLLLHIILTTFLALIMFWLNTIASKFVGASISIALTLASLMKMMFGNWFLWVLPTNLVDLSLLDPYGIFSGIPKLWFAYIYIILLNIILVSLSISATKRNLLGGAV